MTRKPIFPELKPAYDEQRIAATWNRIANAREQHRRRSFWVWILASSSVAAATAIMILAWPTSSRVQPLTSHDPSVSLAPGAIWTAAHEVVLDDESTVRLGVGARLQILANEPSRFSTLLQSGSAHFDVHPGGPHRWDIETPIASVEVVGTAFTMTLHDHRLDVDVERGVVIVHGERVPGRVIRLTAGHQLAVDEPAVPVVAPPMTVPVSPPPPHQPVAVTHPPSKTVANPQTQSLAAVVAEADRLSSAGDPGGAAALLERHRASHSDRSSGLVAFTLGRLYLDVLGKPEQAAVAFGEVIERASPRSLIEDAYARRVEAFVRAGIRDRASTALADYEHAYPHGRRLAALRTMLQAR